MKIVSAIFLSTLLALLNFCTSCNILFKNDDEPKTELEKLPPATQSGENTFGCLIDGTALVVVNSLDMGAINQRGILQFGGDAEIDKLIKRIRKLLEDPLTEGKNN